MTMPFDRTPLDHQPFGSADRGPLDQGVDVLTAAVTLAPLEDAPGSPLSGELVLGELPPVTVGIWELTAGTATDTEVDEIYVILAGRGHVEFVDEGRRVEIAPGQVGRLRAGQRTVWHVTETVRKVYLLGP
jgi:uncharacterized cupin superfamily protein